MDSQEFVLAVERYVVDAAADDTINELISPSGRQKPIGVMERSRWYNELSGQELEYVNSAIRECARTAVFGMLAVIDGARIVDDEKGRFELIYAGNERVLINPQDLDLHDLLR